MNLKEQLNQRLAYHLDRLLALHDGTYDYVKEYVLQGGKQLRPIIFLESVEAWNQEITPAILDVACALEFLHAFFLIHDDIMDGDEMRRGKMTLHTHFIHAGMQDGVGRALVWGDLLYTEVFRLLLAFPDAAIAQELAACMVDITATTAHGQILEAERSSFPSEEDILSFYEKKTALYSLLLPLRAAALVCKHTAPEGTLEALAKHTGIAYQLYDDYIEVIGEKNRRLDGQRCGDVMRLKATPLLLRVLRDLPAELSTIVQSKFASGAELTLLEEQTIIECMHKGCLDEILALCEYHATVALGQLSTVGLPDDSTLAAFLKHYIYIRQPDPQAV